jgi:hypothetical protein
MQALRANERPRGETSPGDLELWHKIARAKNLSYALKHRYSDKTLALFAFEDEHLLLRHFR